MATVWPLLLAAVVGQCLLPPGSARDTQGTVLYAQPAVANLSGVRVLADPTHGGQHNGETLVVFWRMGGQSALIPAAWQVGGQTRLFPPETTWQAPTQLGVAPYAGAAPPPGRNTASSVQWMPHRAEFGCFLDTVHNPGVNGSRLSTIVISYDWVPAAMVRPFSAAHPGHAVRFSAELEVHTAQKMAHSAVYVTISLGLKHFDATTGAADRFVWYETSLFDFDRPFTESVMVDTVSGNPIVHGVLVAGQASRYHTRAPGSAFSANSTYVGYRHFEFSVSGANLQRAIADVNTKFPKFALPTTLSEWGLSHFNVENEGLAGAACGFRLANITITAENEPGR